MPTNFERSLALVLVHEGGWADHSQDPGGATMKGVTLAVFRRYYGADRSKNDLKNISDAQLAHIYRTGYWDWCACDDLPAGIDYAVFDGAVHSGPGQSARWLQAVVGAWQDGAIGPKTLAAVADHDHRDILNDMLDLRLRFLRGRNTWPTFGRGWSRRVTGVRRDALAMVTTEIAVPGMAYEVVRRGDQGPWVRKIQQVLGVRVDGDFGPRTEAALQAWQAENGLEPDGIAGRLTYRAMGLTS